MLCPCKNCLVYIRCKQRIEKITVNSKKEVYYIIDDLVNDCPDLKRFFGIDKLIHKVELRNLFRYNSWEKNKRLMFYLMKQPRGEKLIEEFLNVMGYHELPNLINPKIRIKPGNKK